MEELKKNQEGLIESPFVQKKIPAEPQIEITEEMLDKIAAMLGVESIMIFAKVKQAPECDDEVCYGHDHSVAIKNFSPGQQWSMLTERAMRLMNEEQAKNPVIQLDLDEEDDDA